ncbi:2-hydroxychromene-2-carboxylate isomerase [Ideonella paludis]|uniref:2-hydroxychromene-2-carboxylate isomerase n=1 Tax=Ideonella paludis TaxID=1233411 RepID=A0ABS5DW30_9BURK|nr:2-hydroxychromene-2-carboxylate isomerase [Ideonella paludis]
MVKPAIEFYFDFSSPYAYVANEWIDALAARHGRTVRRHAILLGVAFAAAELKSPVAYPLKREYSLHDFARSARFERVPYVQPTPFPIATHHAARVFWWLHDTQGDAPAAQWARSAFRAYFTQGVVLSDPGALRELAQASGLDAAAAEAAWNDPIWKDRLREANEQALRAGLFGAPFFVVDGEPFWGNDRKAQIERRLAEGPF